MNDYSCACPPNYSGYLCEGIGISLVWLVVLMQNIITLKLLYSTVGDADAETDNLSSAVVAGTIGSVVVVAILAFFVSIIATVMTLNARKRKPRSEYL